MKPLAKILQIARYPVKSMRGEVLESAELTLQGIREDRRYAFVQAESRSSFPWLTARQFPELLLYAPKVELDASGQPVVTVATPGGERLAIQSDELRNELEARSNRSIYLLHDGRGSYDTAQVSVISRQTVEQIANETAVPPDPWRFRPNFHVELMDGNPFDEISWPGSALRFGEAARVAFTEPDRRCMMINLDPETSVSTPTVLQYVVQQRNQCTGVYGAVLTPGEVHAGDMIWLEN